MNELRKLSHNVKNVQEIEFALRSSVDELNTDPVPYAKSFAIDMDSLGKTVFIKLVNGEDESAVDAFLAEQLHVALSPVIAESPALIGESGFWEWLVLVPFRSYFLLRWCEGGEWLENQEVDRPKDATILRAKLLPTNVKSQARHVILRLYLYANCAFEFDGNYGKLSLLHSIDQDVNTAIFERRLGLSAGLSIFLAEAANSITGPKKRSKRRRFFREVNLMLSTVSPEFLLMDANGKNELSLLLDGIAVSVSQ
jgi:hypothetical protein